MTDQPSCSVCGMTYKQYWELIPPDRRFCDANLDPICNHPLGVPAGDTDLVKSDPEAWARQKFGKPLGRIKDV